MSIITNLTSRLNYLPFAELKQALSAESSNYTKIAAVALAIICAAAALYMIVKCFSAKKSSPIRPATPVPTPITIHPTPVPKPSPSPMPQPGFTSPKPIFPPKQPVSFDPQPVDSPASSPLSPRKDRLDDDGWAQALQAVEDAERAERDKRNAALLHPVTPVAPVLYHPTPPKAHMDTPPPSPNPTLRVDESPAQTKTNVKIPHAPFSKSVDQACDQVANNIFSERSFSAQSVFKSISGSNHQQILDLLNDLVREFESRHPVSRKIAYGSSVPAYFAQVKEQSDAERKYLSLVGIRNMLKVGPQIIDDFAKQNFLGGAHHYGSMNGLNAFKYYTGTVVDLDTELDAKSDQEALQRARELIVQFGTKCGIPANSAEEVVRRLPNRKLHLPQYGQPIHTSVDNVDRSNHGIWKRAQPNSSKTHYYVNVPNVDVVLSATLRFPYLLAELAWRAKASNGGVFPKDFLDALFDQGISDMCFNDKIRTFNDFHIEWMAKYDGAETPEETAVRRVDEGNFGDALQKMGGDQAIKTAFTRAALMDKIFEIDDDTPLGIEVRDQSLDVWKSTNRQKLINLLAVHGLWEQRLYRTDDESEFFLLNESSLDAFLPDFYTNLQYL